MLKCYDNSTVQFGCPYDVTRDHDELHEFIECSVNNLGDPHTTSNFGINSSQLECIMIDSFTILWEISKDEHWGHMEMVDAKGKAEDDSNKDCNADSLCEAEHKGDDMEVHSIIGIK